MAKTMMCTVSVNSHDQVTTMHVFKRLSIDQRTFYIFMQYLPQPRVLFQNSKSVQKFRKFVLVNPDQYSQKTINRKPVPYYM